MPKLGRTTPCSDCPWRKRSRPGWLGHDKPEPFFRSAITNEGEHPCHLQVDYDDYHWADTQLPFVDYCAGQLIFFRNWLKNPKRPKLYTAVQAVKPSKRVFATPEEFLRHHLGRHWDDGVVERALWPYPQVDD